MVHLNGRAWPEAPQSPNITSSLSSSLYDDLQSLKERPDRSASSRRSRVNQSSRGPRPLLPRSLKEALQLAELLSKSKLIPKGFETPETCLVGILYGMEVGLSPIAALQRMAVIDGRPTIWGDAALALVQASGLLQSIREEIVEDAQTKALTAICRVQREGRLEPTIGTFSTDDAIRAHLWQKLGPWTDYPKRMLIMRARAFALRDAFPDVLAGLYIREEFEGANNGNSDQSKPLHRQTLSNDEEWSKAKDQRHLNLSNPTQPSSVGAVEINIDAIKTSSVGAVETSINGNDPSSVGAGSIDEVRITPEPRRAPPPPPPPPPELAPYDLADVRVSSTPEVIAEIEPGHIEDTYAFNSSALSGEEGAQLDPETLLDLFDSALCCALDLPTLEEIVDEFAERLKRLPREIQERAQKIIERHQQRVEELDQSFRPRRDQDLSEEPGSTDFDPTQGHEADERQSEIETSLPRGLKALLPNLGLGSIGSFGRFRKNRDRHPRSLASWNARQRLKEFPKNLSSPSELSEPDHTEVEQ